MERNPRSGVIGLSIESVKREGEAKIESLQEQLKTARDERKQRLSGMTRLVLSVAVRRIVA